MKTIKMVVLSVIGALPVLSQQNKPVSDYEFVNLINYGQHSLKISDFRGKLLILDFWSVNCGSCIMSWPKLLETQRRYSGQIQFLLVNPWDNAEKIMTLLAKRKRLTGVDMTLPIVHGDTSLLTHFPVHAVPHLVWISPEGKIAGQTDMQALTDSNISTVLASGMLSDQRKVEARIYARCEIPLYINGNGGEMRAMIAQSSFSKSSSNLNPTYAVVSNPESDQYFVAAINQPLLDMYRLAYSDNHTYRGVDLLLANRIELKVADPVVYTARTGEEFHRDRLYSYQQISLRSTVEELQQQMREDLFRYVGLKAYWTEVEKTCLVLTANDTVALAYREGPERHGVTYWGIDLNNVTMAHFLQRLENSTAMRLSAYPLVDETGFKGRLGVIKFEVDTGNLEAFNQELQRYGLRFRKEPRKVKVLVLEESDKKTIH